MVVIERPGTAKCIQVCYMCIRRLGFPNEVLTSTHTLVVRARIIHIQLYHVHICAAVYQKTKKKEKICPVNMCSVEKELIESV